MQVSIRSPGRVEPRLLAVSEEGTWQEAEKGQPDLGTGWWALPGLADAHSHLAADELRLEPGRPADIRRRAFACLDRGVFLVVDKGWSDDSVMATLGGEAPTASPDLEGAGRMISVEGGYYPGFAVETDPAGLEAVVRQAVDEGRGWVKLVGDWPRKGKGLVANFDEQALARAVDVAHRGGARVAIHTTGPDVASRAVRAGVDSIEHGLFLSHADLEELGGRGGAWVPTVLRMEATAQMLGSGSTGGRLITAALADLRGLLREVPEGVAVLAGTDLATPAGGVAAEVAALHRLGLAAEAAVEAAAGTARRYLGKEPGFAPGLSADAVFFDADPYEEPAVLGRPVAVMRAGKRLW